MQIRRFVLQSVSLAVVFAITNNAWAAGSAILPQRWVNTTLPVQTGAIINVANSCGISTPNCQTNLQNAINLAQPGDTIIIRAGDTFTGNFVLRAKTNPSNKWIFIQSSAVSSLPINTRVSPPLSTHMPKIVSINPAPAISANPDAGYYRLIGLEVLDDNKPNNYGPALPGGGKGGLSYGLISLGLEPNILNVGMVPHHIVIDRCYVHGNPNTHVKWGVHLDGSDLAVIDSYFSDFHGVGQDTQAIAGGTQFFPGPAKITNNYLEGAGENLLFGGGGAGPSTPTINPTDIEIRGNYFYKPWKWRIGDPTYVGIPWSVKNLFELKLGNQVLVDGNVFENNWAMAQSGFAILYQGLPDQDGLQAQVRNVTFSNNIVRHAAGGVNMCGGCIYNWAAGVADPNMPRVLDVTFFNNLFEDIDHRYGNNSGTFGIGYQVLTHSNGVTFDHNTMINSGGRAGALLGDGPASLNFTFTNNLSFFENYGVYGSGTAGLAQTAATFFPGSVVSKNVLMDPANGTSAAAYPQTFLVPRASVSFNNYLAADYALSPSSPYKNAGTDGADIGANMSAILAATAGATACPPQPSCSVFSVQPALPTTPGNNASVIAVPTPVVSPNPWRSDRHSAVPITFQPLPANSRIKIFTISGHLVRELAATGTSLSWDRTNDSGKKVASGIYLYVIDGDGLSAARGKLAIIR